MMFCASQILYVLGTDEFCCLYLNIRSELLQMFKFLAEVDGTVPEVQFPDDM
jgi:hypothetical protein